MNICVAYNSSKSAPPLHDDDATTTTTFLELSKHDLLGDKEADYREFQAIHVRILVTKITAAFREDRV